MKYAFSTLGCPRWSWDDVFTTAKDLGLDGVEIRGLGDEIYAPAIEAFQPEHIEKTKKELARLGLAIPILTSGAILAEAEKAQQSFVEACAYVNLASSLGVRHVRVMGTGEPWATGGDFALGARLFGHLCSYAAEWGVVPLIETNGALASSDEMLKFLEKAGSENCGVLWDVHHTVRFGKESPAETVKKLGGYIRHVHVKDSEVDASGNIQYRMMGHGDLPLKEAVDSLKGIGFEGFVSLEWVKRWQADLQEPGIVFAQYASFVKEL
ncbi:MAG: sugar phosphate isomerase/epimerase [Oscillospiraceae bacterium]|nr:sugar phosphate isomerase/epimerase [Oscillospiraceae bacterium]